MVTETSKPAGATPAASRIDALDGLRGLAILGVIDEHTLPWDRLDGPWLQPLSVALSMGWIGVELFFVISGYLITGILLRSRGQERYYRNFWGRRIVRIVPGYALLVAAVYLLLPSTPDAIMPVTAPGETPLWYALFLVNFFAPLGFMPHQFLLLTWSVSVEQQFYLAWPLICRRLDARRIAHFSGGLFLLATIVRIILYAAGFADTTQLYYLGITHLDGIAAGAFIAAIGAERGGAWHWFRHHRTALTATAAALAVGATGLSALTPIEGGEIALHPVMSLVGYGSFALLFALLLQVATVPDPGPLGAAWRRFLELPALRFIGQISYSLYLVHVPVAFLVQHVVTAHGGALAGWLLTGTTLVATSATLALATLLFTTVERPFIRAGRLLFA